MSYFQGELKCWVTSKPTCAWRGLDAQGTTWAQPAILPGKTGVQHPHQLLCLLSQHSGLLPPSRPLHLLSPLPALLSTGRHWGGLSSSCEPHIYLCDLIGFLFPTRQAERAGIASVCPQEGFSRSLCDPEKDMMANKYPSTGAPRGIAMLSPWSGVGPGLI